MCGLEFPDLEQAVWQPFRDRGVVVVGVNPGGLRGTETASNMDDFVAQTGVTFPVGWEVSQTYGAWESEPGISPFPLDVVVDAKGRVAYIAREYDAEALASVVARLVR